MDSVGTAFVVIGAVKSPALAVSLVLAGCADEPAPTHECGDGWTTGIDHVVALDELPRFAPQVLLSPELDADAPGDHPARILTVSLGFGEPGTNHRMRPIHDADSDDTFCPLLDPGATATVAGRAIAATMTGGFQCLSPVFGPTCAEPTFTLTIPADLHPDSADVVIADGSYTRAFPLGDALAPRSITSVGHADLTFKVGEPITVRWSHAADLTRLPIFGIAFVTPTGHRAPPINRNAITVDGDTLTFTPDVEPGPGRLTVHLEGALADDTTVKQAAYLDITFVP